MDVTKQPGVHFSQIFLSEAHFSHRADALSLPPETRVSSQPISVEARVVASGTGEAVARSLAAKFLQLTQAVFQLRARVGVVGHTDSIHNVIPLPRA